MFMDQSEGNSDLEAKDMIDLLRWFSNFIYLENLDDPWNIGTGSL